MNNINNEFSLRRFPDNVRLQVIKSFDYVELISYSLISKKSKALVKTFNLEINSLTVSLPADHLFISMYFKGCDGCHTFKIYKAVRVSVELFRLNVITNMTEVGRPIGGFRSEMLILNTPDLSFIGWFEHFQYLLKFNKIIFSVTADEEVFNTVEIRNLFPEWTSLNVNSTCPRYYQKILDLFAPCVKDIVLASFQTILTSPHRVGIQNFNHFNSYVSLTLDELLNLNAFVIYTRSFSISDMNRFVKSWINGSNPRMQTIQFYWTRDMDMSKLLKGINYQIVPVGVQRQTNDGRDVVGNIDIRNKKGIMATIGVIPNFCITMTVWN